MFTHRCARCDRTFLSSVRASVFCETCREVRKTEYSRRNYLRRMTAVRRRPHGKGRCRHCGRPTERDGYCGGCLRTLCANACGRCGSEVRCGLTFCANCREVRRHDRLATAQRLRDRRLRPTEADYASGVGFNQHTTSVSGEVFAPSITRGGWVGDASG